MFIDIIELRKSSPHSSYLVSILPEYSETVFCNIGTQSFIK